MKEHPWSSLQEVSCLPHKFPLCALWLARPIFLLRLQRCVKNGMRPRKDRVSSEQIEWPLQFPKKHAGEWQIVQINNLNACVVHLSLSSALDKTYREHRSTVQQGTWFSPSGFFPAYRNRRNSYPLVCCFPSVTGYSIPEQFFYFFLIVWNKTTLDRSNKTSHAFSCPGIRKKKKSTMSSRSMVSSAGISDVTSVYGILKTD